MILEEKTIFYTCIVHLVCVVLEIHINLTVSRELLMPSRQELRQNLVVLLLFMQVHKFCSSYKTHMRAFASTKHGMLLDCI